VGHSQFRPALFPSQPPRSRRWHPGCRRCLLKGCERWFSPRSPQACYCGRTCQKAAERWRRWLACQRYRATIHGKECRREQARRYRERLRERSSPAEPALPTPSVEPASPVIEAVTHSKIDTPQLTPAAGEGQRPAEISENSCGLPCHRPGCYVLFLPAAPSIEQKFCSGLCRQALRRVRQRKARLRLRRRRGVRPLRYPDRDPPEAVAFMSSPY
jgi:hypothetical protein